MDYAIILTMRGAEVLSIPASAAAACTLQMHNHVQRYACSCTESDAY